MIENSSVGKPVWELIKKGELPYEVELIEQGIWYINFIESTGRSKVRYDLEKHSAYIEISSGLSSAATSQLINNSLLSLKKGNLLSDAPRECFSVISEESMQFVLKEIAKEFQRRGSEDIAKSIESLVVDDAFMKEVNSGLEKLEIIKKKSKNKKIGLLTDILDHRNILKPREVASKLLKKLNIRTSGNLPVLGLLSVVIAISAPVIYQAFAHLSPSFAASVTELLYYGSSAITQASMFGGRSIVSGLILTLVVGLLADHLERTKKELIELNRIWLNIMADILKETVKFTYAPELSEADREDVSLISTFDIPMEKPIRIFRAINRMVKYEDRLFFYIDSGKFIFGEMKENYVIGTSCLYYCVAIIVKGTKDGKPITFFAHLGSEDTKELKEILEWLKSQKLEDTEAVFLANESYRKHSPYREPHAKIQLELLRKAVNSVKEVRFRPEKHRSLVIVNNEGVAVNTSLYTKSQIWNLRTTQK